MIYKNFALVFTELLTHFQIKILKKLLLLLTTGEIKSTFQNEIQYFLYIMFFNAAASKGFASFY